MDQVTSRSPISLPLMTVLVFLLISCSAMAQDEMSVREARSTLLAKSDYVRVEPSRTKFYTIAPRTMRITEQGIEFDTLGAFRGKPAEHISIAFSQLRGSKLVCRKGWECEIKGSDGKPLPPRLMLTNKSTTAECSRECPEAAASFFAALKKLVAFAEDKNNMLHDFPAAALAWRNLSQKPPLPDAARVRSMLAEDAVRNNKPQEALKYYTQGLEQYALWPQGWFNAALISAQLGEFDRASEYMQNYLLLVPDAPDAQQARDQVEMWKIKAKESK